MNTGQNTNTVENGASVKINGEEDDEYENIRNNLLRFAM
jgi:hypothetical protein